MNANTPNEAKYARENEWFIANVMKWDEQTIFVMNIISGAEK